MFGLVSSESCFFYFETSILGAPILLPSTWYLSSLTRWMASNNTIVHHCTAPTPTKTSGPLSRSANGSFPIKYTRRKRGGSLHVARNWRCNDSIVIKLLCPLTLPTVSRFPLVPTGNVFSNNMHITATMTSLPNCFFFSKYYGIYKLENTSDALRTPFLGYRLKEVVNHRISMSYFVSTFLDHE